MISTNTVQLIGYVGQDLKEIIRNGQLLSVRMRVATHTTYNDEESNKRNVTVWHTIVAWKHTALFATRNFVKGSKIMVMGRISYETFIGRDGKRHYVTNIHANQLLNLDR